MSPEVIRTSEDPDKPGAIPMQTWLLSLSEEEVRQLVHGGELDRIMGDILKNIAAQMNGSESPGQVTLRQYRLPPITFLWDREV